MGRSVFWLKLSSAKAASDLVSQSPISVGGRIILLVPWYRGFTVTDFDTRFRIPRHPINLLFPGLATKLRPIVRDLGAHFGWLMHDTFVDAAAAQWVPRVKVAVLDPQSIPSEIEIATDLGVLTQRILVTGLPNQCLRCHGFGHQARSCPRFMRTEPLVASRQAAQEPPRQQCLPLQRKMVGQR